MWILTQRGKELINLNNVTEIYVEANQICVDNFIAGSFKTPEDANYVWREMITRELRGGGNYIKIPKADHPYLPSNRKEDET